MAKFLSLGGYCQVAEQIRRSTGQLHASPFDWLVTPIDIVSEILREGGSGFAISATIAEDRDTATCDRYRDTLYHHEFERDYNHSITLGDHSETLLRARSKLIAKTDAFMRVVATEPTVLFHLGTWASARKAYPYVREDRPLAHSDLGFLAASVAEIGSNFRIVHVHHSDLWQPIIADVELDARIHIIDLPIVCWDWEGDDGQWSAIFAEAERLAGELS